MHVGASALVWVDPPPVVQSEASVRTKLDIGVSGELLTLIGANGFLTLDYG